MKEPRRYIDFKLQMTAVDEENGQYHISLLPNQDVGETIIPIPFSINDGIYKENWRDVHEGKSNNMWLQMVGEEIGDWLLPQDSIRPLFWEAVKKAGNGGGVRLVLIIANHALKQIPWEYAYVKDPTTDNPDPFRYLALDSRISIVRHESLSLPHPTLSGVEDLTTLNLYAVAASPKDLVKLSTQAEINELETLFEKGADDKRERTPIEAEFNSSASWSDVKSALNGSKRYHLFHFAGHGEMGDGENFATLDDMAVGWLNYQDKQGDAEIVTAGQFANEIARAHVLLVTLGACETGERSKGFPWHSVAGALLARNIPIVIAMQNKIKDSAAALFSYQFYKSLQAGLTVDEAMNIARVEMANSMLRKEEAKDNMEWGIPVLYTRLPDGVLFPKLVKNGSQAANASREAMEKRRTVSQSDYEVDGINLGVQNNRTSQNDGDRADVNQERFLVRKGGINIGEQNNY